MAPLSLCSTGNPDPSLLKSKSSPTLVNSASCVTLESFHFVFSLLCPCQVAITSHLGLCLMYDLAPVSSFFALFFLPVAYQLFKTVILNYFEALGVVFCHLSHSGLKTNCSFCPCTSHNFPHCLANATYSSGLSLGVTASGKVFMSPPAQVSVKGPCDTQFSLNFTHHITSVYSFIFSFKL